MGLSVLALTLLGAPLFRSHASLYLLIVLLGVAGGLVESHGSAVVAALNPDKAGQYLNLSQAFFCLGGVAAPFTIGYLFKTSLEWQQMLELFGGFIAAIAILFGVTKTREIEEGEVDEPAGTTAPSVPARTRSLLALLSLLMFVYTFGESTVVSWLPSLFEITRHLPKAGAAWLLSLFWAGVMTSRTSMFFFPRSGSMNRVVAGSLVLSATALGLLWLWRGSSVSLVLVALAGLAFGPVWPGIVALARIFGSRSNIGVIGVGGLGAALGPLVSGALIGANGIETVQPLLLALAAVQLVVFVIYRRLAVTPRAK
jgi:fucose permease